MRYRIAGTTSLTLSLLSEKRRLRVPKGDKDNALALLALALLALLEGLDVRCSKMRLNTILKSSADQTTTDVMYGVDTSSVLEYRIMRTSVACWKTPARRLNDLPLSIV